MPKHQNPVTIAEQPAPATPPSGYGALYPKTDGKLYFKNDAGVETELGAGSDFTPYDPPPWTRPADWLPMPTVLATEQKVVGLLAVFDDASNAVAVSMQGAYTVDWGDGTVTNYASSAVAQHVYDFATYDPGGATLTSRGYKTVLITITPQAGQNLTTVSFNHKPTGYSNGNPYHTAWLELLISGPNINNLVLTASSATFHGMVECAVVLSTGTCNWGGLFAYFYSLESVEINTSGATYLGGVFTGCTSLVYAPTFDANGNGTNTTLTAMFSGCSALRFVPVIDLTGVTTLTQTFNACTSLQVAPAWDLSSVQFTASMFQSCYSLVSVPEYDLSSVINSTYMFQLCSSLLVAPVTQFPACTDIREMYRSCTSMHTVPELYAPLATSTSNLFFGCTVLANIGTMTFSAALSSVSNMFRGCASLVVAPLFDTAACTQFDSMFYDCTALETVPAYDTGAGTSFSSMFRRCVSLKWGPTLNTSNGTSFAAMFYQCLNMVGIPLYDSAKVTTFSQMFFACSRLAHVPALSQAAVTSSAAYSAMFTSAYSLRRCDIAFKFSVTFSTPSTLVGSELDRIYTNLPVVVGQTITITGAVGVAGDTPTIATAKGWTVTG